MAGSSPEAAAVERAWRCQPCGVQLAGRGEQCGFLDLVDRPLLVAVLDPARPAACAGGDRVQTKADGDQGRSAERAAWHQRTSVRLLGGGGYLRTGGGRSVVVAVKLAKTAGGAGGRSRPTPAPRFDLTGRCLLAACAFTGCRRYLHAAGADLDALGLGLLSLGYQDLQHAVLERSLDPLGHRMGGEGDRAAEGAVAALDPVELLLGRVVGEVALALDGQQAILH